MSVLEWNIHHTPERQAFLRKLADAGKVDGSRWPKVAPENEDLWLTFLELNGHGRDGMSGALDPARCRALLELHGVPRSRWSSVWRVMSRLARRVEELQKAKAEAEKADGKRN